MDILKGAAGGVIGGLIGAAVWGLIAYNFNVEIGWIAWGIGALVGFGVSIGMGGKGGVVGGVLAIVIALASITAGKYTSIQLAANEHFKELDAVKNAAFTDEMVVESLLDEAAAKAENEGKTVKYNNGKDLSTADSAEDYPVWMVKEIRKYHEGLTDDDRASLRTTKQEEVRTQINAIESKIKSEAFAASFGALDAVFALFAIITAWRLGAMER